MNNESNGNSRYRQPYFDLSDLHIDEDRSIKPLKPSQPCSLPIVAVLPDRSVIEEETGELSTFSEYAERLPEMPRHLVVTFASDSWLWLLHDYWKDDPCWTWQVITQRKRDTKLNTHVSYYGFRRDDRRAFTNMVIDAGSFTNDKETDLLKLGQWVREFCNAHGLRVRASAAGVAGQLLRHPQFYPEARRMVPRFINDTAQPRLPGPFYESYSSGRQQIDAAMYVDQEAAYHYAALQTPLPNANSIHAWGHAASERVYASAGGELYAREMRKHGLLHAEVYIPPLQPEEEKFVPRHMRKPGLRRVWVWTNEVPYLESFGIEVRHLVSVWGTAETDLGIKRYAQWAWELSRRNPHLKALLLMPYGVLGRKPGKVEIHTPGGEDELLIAGRWIEGTKRRPVNVQTYTANTLQLGLIQAHVRALSLDMARQMTAKGNEVVSVYADGIFVRLGENGQLPMFAPWRVKEDNLELHLSDSLRAPVRAAARRDYLTTKHEGIA